MRILLTAFSTLVGFVFTLGGPWNTTTAQEARPSTTGTVVISRQNPSMTADWRDGQQKLRTILAATKDDKPDKGGKTKKDTKPTKKTKSPSKYQQL